MLNERGIRKFGYPHPPDAVKFQKYFNLRFDTPAPLLRTHPVEIFYMQEPERNFVDAAINTILMNRAEDPGNILLFLTSEEQIGDACKKIKLEADELVNWHSEALVRFCDFR